MTARCSADRLLLSVILVVANREKQCYLHGYTWGIDFIVLTVSLVQGLKSTKRGPRRHKGKHNKTWETVVTSHYVLIGYCNLQQSIIGSLLTRLLILCDGAISHN